METNLPLDPTAFSSNGNNANKRLFFVVGGIVVLVILLVLLTVFTSRSVSQKNTLVSPTLTQAGSKSIYGDNNPMINKQETQREEKGVQNVYQQSGKQEPTSQPEHHLKFILPSKYKDGTSFLSLPQTYAASSSTDCSGKLSGSVNVYLLQNNLTTVQAKAYADAYKFSVSASSIPMGDGISFFYTYTDNYKSFLNVAQPSGETHYHLATSVTTTGKDIGQVAADSNAKTMLAKYVLDSKGVYDPGVTALYPTEYVTSFTKLYDLYPSGKVYPPVVDSELIITNGSPTVCGVQQTTSSDSVIIHQLKEDGTLTKIDDATRKITGVLPAKGITVDESLTKEYGVSSPSFEPIVVPLTTKTSDLESVAVDSVALVWFDYPDTYKQLAYVPMYLVAGKLSSGARAYGLFPAIAKDDFTKLSLSSTNANDQLQLQPYYPPLPKPTYTPGSSGACFGNQVDYTVTCRQGSGGGIVVCSHYFEGYVGSKNQSSSNNDPLNICTSGNKSVSDPNFSSSSGSDPCKAFVDKQGIDTSGSQPGAYPGFGNGSNIYGSQGTTYSGGPLLCTLSGNPC